MERVLNYFTSLYPNHLGTASTDHYSHLLAAAKTMSSACSSIEAEAQRLKVCSGGFVYNGRGVALAPEYGVKGAGRSWRSPQADTLVGCAVLQRG